MITGRPPSGPELPWVAAGLIVTGVVGLGVTALLFYVALRRDRAPRT